MDVTRDNLLKKLRDLEQEHEELNEIIDDPESITNFSQFTLKRFKKRRLLLKDEIRLIKDSLYPDIIA